MPRTASTEFTKGNTLSALRSLLRERRGRRARQLFSSIVSWCLCGKKSRPFLKQDGQDLQDSQDGSRAKAQSRKDFSSGRQEGRKCDGELHFSARAIPPRTPWTPREATSASPANKPATKTLGTPCSGGKRPAHLPSGPCSQPSGPCNLSSGRFHLLGGRFNLLGGPPISQKARPIC